MIHTERPPEQIARVAKRVQVYEAVYERFKEELDRATTDPILTGGNIGDIPSEPDLLVRASNALVEVMWEAATNVVRRGSCLYVIVAVGSEEKERYKRLDAKIRRIDLSLEADDVFCVDDVTE